MTFFNKSSFLKTLLNAPVEIGKLRKSYLFGFNYLFNEIYSNNYLFDPEPANFDLVLTCLEELIEKNKLAIFYNNPEANTKLSFNRFKNMSSLELGTYIRNFCFFFPSAFDKSIKEIKNKYGLEYRILKSRILLTLSLLMQIELFEKHPTEKDIITEHGIRDLTKIIRLFEHVQPGAISNINQKRHEGAKNAGAATIENCSMDELQIKAYWNNHPPEIKSDQAKSVKQMRIDIKTYRLPGKDDTTLRRYYKKWIKAGEL